MGQEDGADKPVVDELRSIESPWHKAPDQEDALKKPVEWNQEQDEIWEKLDEAQWGENDPIGQPESVVLLVPTLNS